MKYRNSTNPIKGIVVKGYYKNIGGKITENLERSKSDKIRASNVWIDIQQVFHLREENVNGCFVQKPIKSVERIIEVSSKENDLVIDFFSHSGTTTLAAENDFLQQIHRQLFAVPVSELYRDQQLGPT